MVKDEPKSRSKVNDNPFTKFFFTPSLRVRMETRDGKRDFITREFRVTEVFRDYGSLKKNSKIDKKTKTYPLN